VSANLTNLEVNELVFDWYKKLDIHTGVEEILPLINSSEFEMRLPEATLRSAEDFKGWYHSVTNKFFDEIHDMKMLNVDIAADTANVKLVVNWQAHVWNPPAAKSTWLGFDAYQSWVVKRDDKTGGATISSYTVDKLDAMPGSAQL
jgi:hypothetical protein